MIMHVFPESSKVELGSGGRDFVVLFQTTYKSEPHTIQFVPTCPRTSGFSTANCFHPHPAASGQNSQYNPSTKKKGGRTF